MLAYHGKFRQQDSFDGSSSNKDDISENFDTIVQSEDQLIKKFNNMGW